MFQGQDGATISIHQYGDLDYRPIFAELEPIFWRYGGRPHWGKLHTLKSSDLAALYPKHWRDFLALRESLDPDKRLMNAHLKELFGA
jgi:FAD/FMN-containing dehydrogenase